MLDVKINTVIVGKDQTEVDELQSILENFEELSIVGTATKGNQGISIITNFAPELVFVNVNLQDVNGLEFVRVLQSRNIFPEFVFVALDSQFAYESLVLSPLDYLIKPIDNELIQKLLTRLKLNLKKKELIRKMDAFTNSQSDLAKRVFNQKGGIIILNLEEIVFCKAEGAATILMLKTEEVVQLKSGISETLETINSEDFVRIGRSYFINRNFLRKIDKRNYECQMYFEGKSWEVPASKNTISQLEKLNVYPVQ